jgi:hypothetical protein
MNWLFGLLLVLLPQISFGMSEPCVEPLKAVVVKQSASQTPSVDEFVRSLEGEEHLLAMVSAGVQFSRLSESDQNQVVQKLIEGGQQIPLAIFAKFMKGDAKFNAFRVMAERMPMAVAGNVTNSKEFSDEQKKELLEAAIAHATYGDLALLFSSPLYSLRPVATRYSGFLIRAISFTVRAGAALSAELKRSSSKSTFDKIAFLSKDEKDLLLRHALQNDPLSPIMSLTNANITVDTPFVAPRETSDLKRAITDFAKTFPDLFPEQWLQIVTSGVTNREVALGLIRELA